MKKSDYRVDTLVSNIYGYGRGLRVYLEKYLKAGEDYDKGGSLFSVNLSDNEGSCYSVCETNDFTKEDYINKVNIQDKTSKDYYLWHIYDIGEKIHPVIEKYYENYRKNGEHTLEDKNSLIELGKELINKCDEISKEYGWDEKRDKKHFFDFTLNEDGYYTKKGITFEDYYKNKDNSKFYKANIVDADGKDMGNIIIETNIKPYEDWGDYKLGFEYEVMDEFFNRYGNKIDEKEFKKPYFFNSMVDVEEVKEKIKDTIKIKENNKNKNRGM